MSVGLRAIVPLLAFAVLGLTLAVLALRLAAARSIALEPSPDQGSQGAAGLRSVPPIDSDPPTKTGLATFAMGCFYEAEARFGVLPGVVRTRVGYAGGSAGTPSYAELGDHSEVVQVEYDPAAVTYQQLLDAFWSGHDPSYRHWSRRYASIVFYHSKQQRVLAEQSREHLASRVAGRVLTEIRPVTELHLAERWHQKYHVRQVPQLEAEYREIYPDPAGWIASTALARVNGYLAGYGKLGALRRDLQALGLSLDNQRRLLSHWRPVVGTQGTRVCKFEDLSKSPLEP